MSDPIEHFRLTIGAAGLEAPDNINADGAIHRFSTNGTNCAITALDAIPPNLDAVVSWLDRVTGVQS